MSGYPGLGELPRIDMHHHGTKFCPCTSVYNKSHSQFNAARIVNMACSVHLQ
ncbi:hypothetical protein J6590_093969 [Homalodisca vitripennis]|nr:hypothetical protein J6590_093969 [Homalodisca vitripennis]